MIKIVVNSEKTKQKIIEESEYLHDFIEFCNLFKGEKVVLYDKKTNFLAHIYADPNSIIVEKSDFDEDDAVGGGIGHIVHD